MSKTKSFSAKAALAGAVLSAAALIGFTVYGMITIILTPSFP